MYWKFISIFIFIILSSCTHIPPTTEAWTVDRLLRYSISVTYYSTNITVPEANFFNMPNYKVYFTDILYESSYFEYQPTTINTYSSIKSQAIPQPLSIATPSNKFHVPYLGTYGNVIQTESNLLVFDGFSDFIDYTVLINSNTTHLVDFPVFTNRLIGGTEWTIRYRDVTSGLCPVAFDKAGTYDIRPASMQDFSFYTGTLTASDITELQDFTNGLPAYNVHLTVISNPIGEVSLNVSNIQLSPAVYYYRILLAYTNALTFSWKDVAASIMGFPVLVSGMVEDDRTGVLYSGRYLGLAE